jgi:hypothetical protein
MSTADDPKVERRLKELERDVADTKKRLDKLVRELKQSGDVQGAAQKARPRPY